MESENFGQRPCEDCGSPAYRRKPRGRWPRFCEVCALRRVRAFNAAKAQAWRDRTKVVRDRVLCGECGAMFEPAQYGKVAERCETCARSRIQRQAEFYYRVKARRQPPSPPRFGTCGDCAASFLGPRRGLISQWCPRCRRQHLNDYREAPPVRTSVICADCGQQVPLTSRKGYSRRRCAECAHRRWGLMHRKYFNALPKDVRATKWRTHSRRRNAIRRGMPVEKFTDLEIYERDGWICQIGFHPIDPASRYPDPGSPSLDHILPVSYVGSGHTRANVRLACLVCNSRRQNKVSDADLALLGLDRDSLVLRHPRRRRISVNSL